MEFTVTPNGANSTAESRVKFTRPAFATGYAGPPPPAKACTDAMCIIRPAFDFLRCGTAHFVAKNGPRKLTPMTRSQSGIFND